MRTTSNLDDDVAAALTELARERARSLSRVANDLLRTGMRADRERVELPPYEAPTFDTGRPLVDMTDIAAALDLLDAADTSADAR